MSQGLPPLPPEVSVRRSADPIYMAHGYLTKVPVRAIIPFLEAFTKPGDLGQSANERAAAPLTF